MKYPEDGVVLDRRGNPLTKDEIHFLNLMDQVGRELGAGAVLGFKAILEAMVNRARRDEENKN